MERGRVRITLFIFSRNTWCVCYLRSFSLHASQTLRAVDNRVFLNHFTRVHLTTRANDASAAQDHVPPDLSWTQTHHTHQLCLRYSIDTLLRRRHLTFGFNDVVVPDFQGLRHWKQIQVTLIDRSFMLSRRSAEMKTYRSRLQTRYWSQCSWFWVRRPLCLEGCFQDSCTQIHMQTQTHHLYENKILCSI